MFGMADIPLSKLETRLTESMISIRISVLKFDNVLIKWRYRAK